jgi:hypothetical protein
MPPAKLSGSLLVRRDARMATTPPDDLSVVIHGADAKGPGGPVLVWSAPPENEAEPNTDKDPTRATHRATAAPAIARWTVLPAVAVAVSVLAIGCVGGSLILRPNGAGLSTETALSVAPSTASEKSVITATAIASAAARDSAAPATPTAEFPDHPAEAPAPTPGATPSAGTANPSATRAEPLGSTELNSALLARGDGLFVLGDLSSARMLYERAATAGHGQAALRLGETYDPAFLARTRIIGARANAAIAAYWYQRASQLGTPGADILLAAIAAETGHSSP